MVHYRKFIRCFVRYLSKVSLKASVLVKAGAVLSRPQHERCEALVQNFKRPSRERVSGKGGHRGGRHKCGYVTGISQGRGLGVQDSVTIRVVTKSVVRAWDAGRWGGAEYVDRSDTPN